MRIGIIVNLKKKDKVLPLFREFSSWMKDKNGSLILARRFVELLDKNDLNKCEIVERTSELIQKSDLIITFGGDGTMLSTARKVHDSGTPLLGFHLGNLGFLAQLTKDNYKDKVSQLLEGKYQIEERMIMEAKVEHTDKNYSMYALNDIVISKGNTPRMIRFQIYVDGHIMNSYNSDGIIIASPTGSTAYSLSASGPILTPDLNAIVINPICPHSLTNRPIVIHADRHIEIKFTEVASDGHITADGQHFFPLNIQTRIHIRKAAFSAKFIRLEGSEFFKVLHSKLGWGK